MKRLALILLLALPVSCSDAINDLLDDLKETVPICVDSASTATAPDGRGWKNAYKTIQDAIDNPNAKEIWVKAGGKYSAAISITRPVKLYGGFNGTESRQDERSTVNTLTEITGVVSFSTSAAGSETLLDCFTITGTGIDMAITGSASPTINNCRFNLCINSSDGGAMQINGSSPTISQCTFTNCSATNGGAIYAVNSVVNISKNCTFTKNTASNYGGAIYAASGSAVNISNSDFGLDDASSGNSATDFGGAIYATDSNTKITISNGNFKNNKGTDFGGAISTNGNVELNISSGSSFTYNQADISGGCLCIDNGGTVRINNSDFTDNSAPNGGGGVIFSDHTNTFIIDSCNFVKNLPGNSSGNTGGGALKISGSLTISNSIISNYITSGPGGGIYCSSSGEAMISTCKFSGNETTNGNGGAIYCTLGKVTLYACKLINNTASNGNGGGIYCIDSGINKLTLINCLMANNSANSSSGIGGAIYIRASDCDIYCSSLINNTAGVASQSIFATRSDTSSSTMNISNSIIWCNTGAVNSFLSIYRYTVYSNYNFYKESATVNSPAGFYSSNDVKVFTDPLLSDTLNGDFTLTASSPCINAGRNDLIPTNVATDIAGNPRVVNGTVDIGAYEAQ
jgi:predicted outer membrane repeat protein